MPTNEERIKALRAKIAATEGKIADLKPLQRLKETIRADAEKLASLEADEAKKAANRKRKEDNLAKIVLASGVLLSPADRRAQTIRAAMEHLSPKDREFLEKWCAIRGLDLDAPPPAEISHPASGSPPLGEAVVHVINGLDQGSYEWLTSELLSRTSGKDREVIETLIASRA